MRMIGWLLATSSGLVIVCAGCSSEPKARPDVEVVFRFDNVRKQGGFDEWNAIGSILSEHSRREIQPLFSRNRTIGDAELREIQATVVVSEYATLDQIQNDLDKLSQSSRKSGGSWWNQLNPFSSDTPAPTAAEQVIDFSLSSANVRYVSNFVTSRVSVVIAGHTQARNTVTLFIDSSTAPMSVVADGSGLWRANISGLPESGYIYGTSEDAARKTRPKHFRVNATTLKHENITRDAFERDRPVYEPPKPVPVRSTSGKLSGDPKRPATK